MAMKLALLPGPSRRSRLRGAACRIASVFAAFGLLLAVFTSRGGAGGEQHATQQQQQQQQQQRRQPSSPYAVQLQPLLRQLEASPDALLAPLVAQLLAAPPVSIPEARAIYADALSRFKWPGAYRRAWRPRVPWARASPAAALRDFVDSALSLIASESRGRLIDCDTGADGTIPSGVAAAAAGRVALVSNLRNAEGMAPNAMLQILKTAIWAPPGQIFVLIYEDGSGDLTRRWLSLLQLLLPPAGVPAQITLNGSLLRAPGEPRITHLARLRNALVDPFYPSDGERQARCADLHAAAGGAGGGGSLHSGGVTGSGGRVVVTPAACFEPERFLFVNDVFFCHDDMARLILRGDEADMACGFDVYTPKQRRRSRRRRARAARRRALRAAGGGLEEEAAAGGDGGCGLSGGGGVVWNASLAPGEQAAAFAEAAWPGGLPGAAGWPAAGVDGGWADAAHAPAAASRRLSESPQGGGKSPDAAAGGAEPKRKEEEERKAAEEKRRKEEEAEKKKKAEWPPKQFLFYDFWVARDVAGGKFGIFHPPFALELTTRARGAAGLPFPVQCCWNGMAMVTAEAFRRGLRFRTHLPGECMASECSLLCDDMHRVGLGRILVDPQVVTTYQQEVKAALHHKPHYWNEASRIAHVPWAAAAKQPPLNWSDPRWRVFSDQIECCDLTPEREIVEFEKCHRRDHAAPGTNYTAAFGKMCAAPCARRERLLGALAARRAAAAAAGSGGKGDGKWVRPAGRQEEMVALLAYCPACSQ